MLGISGKSLEYLCLGPPPSESPSDSPIIVMLHEGLGCNSLWRDFPAKLYEATGFGIFAYSRAGYGQSDATELPRTLDYMTREAVDVLPEVLSSMGVENAVLVGHSDGATIAAIHAGSFMSTRLAGVVLIAPHFFVEDIALKAIATTRDAYDQGDLQVRLARHHKDADNAFRGWNDTWLDADFKDWNIESVLQHIAVPVLAIQGREDPYGTLAQIDALSTRVICTTVSRLILNNCQHAPHLEHQTKVVDAISEFCKPLVTSRLTVSIDLPSHAYIPGKTERHAEDAFDALRQTAIAGQSADELAQSQAFKAGLLFFKSGFYWEAHEVWEPVWMVLPDDSREKRFVQGLIQLANGYLKLRMQRPKAVQRLVAQCRSFVPVHSPEAIMTVTVTEVHRWIDALEAKAKLAL